MASDGNKLEEPIINESDSKNVSALDEERDVTQPWPPINEPSPSSSSHTLAEPHLTSDFTTTCDLEQINERQNAVRVDRAKRRGLLAQITAIPEVVDPYRYSNRIKWLITFVVAIAAAAAPIGSGILFPVLDQITSELHTNATTTNLSVAFYMLAMGIFPLWWSSFSEVFGRRNIYLVSFALYIVFSVLSATSKTIATLTVFRLLSGGAAASVQAVGAGTIADCWQPFQRGKAMSIFYLGPLLGPLLSPIVGGALGEKLGWRATQWGQAVFGGVAWLLLLLVLPETLRRTKDVLEKAAEAPTNESRPELKRMSTKHSVKQKSLKWIEFSRMVFVDPLRVVLYLQYMPVLLTVYYAAVTFATLYILNVSIQYIFEQPPYEFSTIILGLLYLPNSLGYLVSSLFGGPWIDRIMIREAKKANRYDDKGNLILLPEDRMRENAWLGAIIFPGALLWYGWTADKGIFWLVPMIANFFYGIGSMLIFNMATTMLTEFMPKRSSAGVALNNLVRNTFAAVGAIIGIPIIRAIGNGWLFTILGSWAMLSSVIIWLMRRNGPRWRARMQEALG